MFYSPLRYPGGKGKISSLVKNILRQNNLMDCTYVEPYSGGAGVALALLLEGFARYIVINDLDPEIYAFWEIAVNNTDYLCDRIEHVKVSMDEWYRQKEINANHEAYDIKDVAFSTFFLNRTNRSGIIKGGVIGGTKQDGKYKIDARFNKANLIERIKLIGKYRKRISVHNKDALELVDFMAATNNQKIFFYFDPPYFNKGQTLYKNSYTENDHAAVAQKIQALNLPWIVTYDDVPNIRDLYSPSSAQDLQINYSACKRGKGQEVLFYNNIELPHITA